MPKSWSSDVNNKASPLAVSSRKKLLKASLGMQRVWTWRSGMPQGGARFGEAIRGPRSRLFLGTLFLLNTLAAKCPHFWCRYLRE